METGAELGDDGLVGHELSSSRYMNALGFRNIPSNKVFELKSYFSVNIITHSHRRRLFPPSPRTNIICFNNLVASVVLRQKQVMIKSFSSKGSRQLPISFFASFSFLFLFHNQKNNVVTKENNKIRLCSHNPIYSRESLDQSFYEFAFGQLFYFLTHSKENINPLGENDFHSVGQTITKLEFD